MHLGTLVFHAAAFRERIGPSGAIANTMFPRGYCLRRGTRLAESRIRDADYQVCERTCIIKPTKEDRPRACPAVMLFDVRCSGGTRTPCYFNGLVSSRSHSPDLASLAFHPRPSLISVSRVLSLAPRPSGAKLQDACRTEGLERARNGLMQMTLAAKEKEGYPPINRGTAVYPVSRSPLDTCRGTKLLL